MSKDNYKISIFKIILYSFCLLLIIQFITLNLFSEKRKVSTVIEDLEWHLITKYVDSLAFNSNIEFDEGFVRSSFKSRFKDTINYINFCRFNEWSGFRIDSNYLAIIIVDSSKVNFVFEAETQIGTLYYGEDWYNKYVWILYKWFKLEHESRGVS